MAAWLRSMYLNPLLSFCFFTGRIFEVFVLVRFDDRLIRCCGNLRTTLVLFWEWHQLSCLLLEYSGTETLQAPTLPLTLCYLLLGMSDQ